MTIARENISPAPADTAYADTDVAVIGINCRFPDASDPAQFWENLAGGVNSIREIPADRWDWRKYFGDPQEPNKCCSKWGGFIDDMDKFDGDFFQISPAEAQLMDPQQRLMLQLCWGCLEDAGYLPGSLAGSNTGVFVGTNTLDYRELIETLPTVEAYKSTGNYSAFIPNRISYVLNLHGPSMPCDAACASALYALHCATQSINSGESSMALVGAVNAILMPSTYVALSKGGFLSPTGQCRTFDAGADGYVRGEGGGVILLKSLAKAIQDGDHIYGVVKGSAINHNGKSQTLTSPNAFAQSQVIQDAYKRAGISPDRVGYIEVHGTGTPKGDPMEITGLKRAWRYLEKHFSVKADESSCGLCSVKTNIGHLESAAGIASLIKVLLAFEHRKLPPLANFKKMNPDISLRGSPFYLVTELREWEGRKRADGGEEPLVAGISSFGWGGTNAHVVLQSYQPAH